LPSNPSDRIDRSESPGFGDDLVEALHQYQLARFSFVNSLILIDDEQTKKQLREGIPEEDLH
jgi:hypothetical protein